MKTNKILPLISLAIFSAASFGLGACSQQSAQAQSSLSTISGSEAKKIIKDQSDIVIIDVRTAEEFASGHIANATNIDFYSADFGAQISALPKDKTYIVYCRSGNRSGKSMQTFKDQGFTKVYNVAGGIGALQ